MNRRGFPRLTVLIVLLSGLALPTFGQVLVVDQASGTADEVVTTATQLPDLQIAQSFTPSLAAVGFVQLSQYVPALPGNSSVMVVVNLRSGSYDGPIVSSTIPEVLINHGTEHTTFYFSGNVPVTPTQLYFFEPVLQSGGFWDIGYKFPSSYPYGDAWNNGAPSGATDYWFREGIVMPVPEPGMVWLVVLGGGLFILFRRRETPA